MKRKYIAFSAAISLISLLLYSTVNAQCNVSASASSKVICSGSFTTLTGAGDSTYTWAPSAGLSSSTGAVVLANPTTTTTYTLTASNPGDTINCTTTVVIIVNPLPILKVTANNGLCDSNQGNATVSASDGLPPYSYLWSNGSTSRGDSNLATGVYSVTVTDSNTCSASSSAAISNTNGPVVSPNVVNVNCYGDSTGSIHFNPTGSGPYICSWVKEGNNYFCPGQTIQINSYLNNIPAGTYIGSIENNNGCATIMSFTLTQPSPLTINTFITNAACSKNNGSATVNVSGGATPYIYSWNHGSTTTSPGMVNLKAGSYPVTVMDSNGCTTSTNALVNDSNGPAPYVTGTTAFNCVLGSSGSVSVDDTIGTPPDSYIWNNGQTTQILSGVTGGTYFVTVADSNGCIGNATITVPQTLPPGATVCMVTVDTVQKVSVIWSGSNSRHIQNYSIYCKASNESAYRLITTLCAGSGAAIYTDSAANAQGFDYNYEVSETDSCGNESPLSAAVNSIYMTVSSNGSTITLNWVPYQGAFGNYYYIYRDTVMNAFVLYDSVPNTVFTYTDTKPLITSKNVYYTVGVENPAGCNINEGKIGKGPPPPSIYTSAKSNTRKIIPGKPTSLSYLNAENSVRIYPNPSGGIFYIDIAGVSQLQDVCICITDVTGQILFTNDYGKVSGNLHRQVNLTGVSRGIYFIRISGNNSVVNKRIVVQ